MQVHYNCDSIVTFCKQGFITSSLCRWFPRILTMYFSQKKLLWQQLLNAQNTLRLIDSTKGKPLARTLRVSCVSRQSRGTGTRASDCFSMQDGVHAASRPLKTMTAQDTNMAASVKGCELDNSPRPPDINILCTGLTILQKNRNCEWTEI